MKSLRFWMLNVGFFRTAFWRKVFLCSGIAAISMGISGCVAPGILTENTPLEPLISFSPTYKHTVQISGSDAAINQHIVNLLTADGKLVATLDTEANMRLNIIPNTQVNRAENRAQIAGLLDTVATTYTHTLNFSLTDTQGRVLTNGQKSITTKPTQRITASGRTADAPALTQPQLTALLNPVLQEIQPHIQAQDWRAQVIGVLDGEHIAVNVGPAHGLAVKHLLQTETRPITKYEVATFETYPNGTTRAVLRRLNGPQVRVGGLLVPAF